MITRREYEAVKGEALAMLDAAGIALRPDEAASMEVADFGLGRVREVGLELIVYVNTARCCAKELVLLPRQMCPEHRHPPVEDQPGKEETFRCRSGEVHLYVPGPPTGASQAWSPTGSGTRVVAGHQVTLGPGQQWTIAPDTPHWFRAGAGGAIVSEFSTRSMDEHDIFTDPDVDRIMRISEDAGPRA
ncbi:MAG: D-lyxose/D-mannose family sugar isomerase [Candidatus Dormibacteraceae bacterium]